MKDHGSDVASRPWSQMANEGGGPSAAKTAEAMTRDERSCLVYVESCAVDCGGMLTGERMNADDHAALKRFAEDGLLTSGRIPACLLGKGPRGLTHWAKLTDAGWSLAHQLRRARAEQVGPYATSVLAEVDERRTRHEGYQA